MKNTLGKLLRGTITEKNISRIDLCRGLCSPSMLTKYLGGERRMDRLLLTALMQRLGLSPDKFVTRLPEKEYYYFDWRQRLAVAQLERDWGRVLALLEEDAAREPACNPAIREQYSTMIRIRAEAEFSGDKSGISGLYREAIQRTVPDFPEQLGVHTYLSMQEINFILLWNDSCPNREDAVKVLAFLESYVLAWFSEEQELVKLYPKVAARYLPILYEQGRYYECMAMAERAVEMMVTSGYASSMGAVMDNYVKAAERLGMEEQVHKEKVQLGAWRELMQELWQTKEEPDDEFCMMDVWQEVDLLDEVLRRNRQYQGYSQEELSEGICTPETLSRIETARHAPNTSTFLALAEKLNLRGDYYYSSIETDNLTLLDQEWQITKLIMKRRWEQAEKVVREMREKLDLSYRCNRQYLENEKFSIDCGMGRIPVERQLETAKEILAITVRQVPDDRDVRKWREDFWNCPFSAEEIGVMMNMADALMHEKEWEQADFLLEKLLEHYQRSRVRPEFHFRTIILIVARLSQCNALLENHEKELLYSEEGIRLCRVSGTWKILSHFLNNKADALERLGRKETGLKYYRLAFYCAELFENAGTAPLAKRYT